jgi:hypothetical protein
MENGPVMLANASAADVHTLFLVLAALFVLAGLYLLVAVQNYIGAVIAIVCAIIVVLFLA